MIQRTIHPPVSSFHTLGDETVKHGSDLCNTPCNNHETAYLKALAIQVLERNRQCNKDETGVKKTVSSHEISDIPMKQNFIASDDWLERAAMIEHEAGIPREWAEAFARVCHMEKPEALSKEGWQRVMDNTGRLLDGHINDLIGYGWDRVDVFGCHPKAPERRLDSKGLLLSLQSTEALAVIDERAIALRKPSGSVLYYTKRPDSRETVMIWELK